MKCTGTFEIVNMLLSVPHAANKMISEIELLRQLLQHAAAFVVKASNRNYVKTLQRERARGLFVNIVITISDNAGMERNKRIPRLTDPPGFF